MPSPPASPPLAAALAYAQRGWRVVPLHEVLPGGVCSCGRAECGSPGKHPRTKHGLTDGTTDADAIRGWWANWPRANVAVVCGRASGVWMVGPDGDAGIDDLVALCRANGDELSALFAGAAVARSQGGGRHLVFAWPADGGPIPNRKNHRGTKIDTRAEGDGPGYFVAPPSVGPSGAYRWIGPPEDCPGGSPAEAPDWLVAWARGTDPKPEPERAADGPVTVPAPKPATAPSARPAADPLANRHGRIVAYLAKCPPSIAGQRGHDDLFRAARALVVGFALSDADALSYLHNHFNDRCQPKWSQKELEHKVQDAREKPFGKPPGYLRDSPNPLLYHPPEREPRPAGGPPPAAGSTAKPSEGITAAELILMEFPPLKYAVDGLLIEGLTLLAGRPKKGKSWLSLMIGWAVAGGHALDGRATTQGEVLYLALEDTKRRLQRRLVTLRGGVDPWPVPAALHLFTAWPRGADGIQALGEWLAPRKGSARLVIVDTLAKFRPPVTGQGNGYSEDYETISAIKAVADASEANVLVVHHTRKMKADDPFDEISGTQGLMGAADAAWVLDSGESKTADLFVTGRDLGEATVPLTFEPAFCRWRLGETVEGVARGGRATAPTPAAEKREKCQAWLKEFLAAFAYPSAEIDKAAKAAGHGFTALRDAKVALGRQGTQEITNHNFRTGGQNDWWSGLGPVTGWRFRPGPGIPPGYGESESQKVNGRRTTAERGSPGESESQNDDVF